MYKVGGCVRDHLLGVKTKDIDFVVVHDNPEDEIDTAFSDMRNKLIAAGFTIYDEQPKFLTIRAKFPESMRDLFGGVKDADFVLARKDGPYSDGRRPDWVSPGTLEDDLARRDFTMNAMVMKADGTIVDPHRGQSHMADKEIHFVGDAFRRIAEDGLRVARALRFAVTKDMELSDTAHLAITSSRSASDLARTSKERREVELAKMFAHDTLASLNLIASMPQHLQEAFLLDIRLKGDLSQ